nr:uncharacterized protein LOC114926138 [Arachis hypogaea]
MYNIRRAAEYKIVESDQLRYNAQWQDHRRLDSKVIAQHIFTMIKADPTISIRVLQGGVENHFGYKASCRKVWLAKQRVIARILWYLGATYDTALAWFSRHCHVSSDFLDVSTCVETFKHYKPLISINGTHLYGKYGGTLLMAIA